jgi:hypothetical protein
VIFRNIYLYFCLIVFGFSQTPDHLIFHRISPGEKDAEYVEIKNPTGFDIFIGDYYITDATKPVDSSYYFNLPSGENFWSHSINDFIARFPDTTVSAGSSFILSFHDSTRYFNYYNEYPDFTLSGNMLNAIEGEQTISIIPNYAGIEMLQNPEVLILFKWTEGESLVQDVDYFLWGDTTYGVSKTNGDGYQSDTPLSQQSVMPAISGDQIYQRRRTEEKDEILFGGNGITGHDETSENLIESWAVLFNPLSIMELSDIINGDPETDVDYLVTIMGLIVEFGDKRPSNGPQIITIEDHAGYRMDLTIWNWDVAQSSIGYMVDYYNPAEYVIQARGTVDNYRGNWQVEIASADDILEADIYLKEGIFSPDSMQTMVSINPAPFVLIPTLGERLDYSYSFPNDAKVIIRIFDLGGRFITTLVDRYFENAGTVVRNMDKSDWDGRDHLGQIVSPGTYIMHIEANQFHTGKSFIDYAPVVVGVKSN